MFSLNEFDALKRYVNSGGNVLVCLQEGGETRAETNLNYFLEEFGISVNSDSCVRSVFYKYFHPKENLITSGVINKEIARVALGRSKSRTPFGSSMNAGMTDGPETEDSEALKFVYPFGATLNIQKPAMAILSSGPLSVPNNRPIASLYTTKSKRGRIVVMGSVKVWADEYLDNEDNYKLSDILLKWLLGEGDIELEEVDEPDLSDFAVVPDVQGMADNLKSCLQTSEDVPVNFADMFDNQLFKFDVDMIPETVEAYEKMGVKHEQLTLIPPQFEAPMPDLVPAVFPPNLKEFAVPPLELFDLDDQFASEKIRLAQLTNKCNDSDLEFFIKEAGEILGVSKTIESHSFGFGSDPKAILYQVLSEIVEYKKSS